MKLKKILSLALVGAMTLGLVACGGSDTGSTNNNEPAKKQDVALRMWGAEEDQEMLKGMVETFKEEYKDYANITVEIGVESEATAKDTLLTDVSAGADVYAFASDQLTALINAGALLKLDDVDATLKQYAGKGVADIKDANGGVDTAMQDGSLYAFPMTADNGYFLFYDSTVLSADDVKTWDGLLAAAEKAGKKVGMVYASGWYNCSFFIGAGFGMSVNADGTTSLEWNKKANYSGLDVAKSMIGIASSPAFMGVNDGGTSSAITGGQLCAIISGVWDAQAWETQVGNGYAATKLPTFTCAGDQVQQGSIVGCKLVGVNPYSENAGWAALLAEWITNEQNQKIRFEERGLGPSNKVAASSDAVKANVAIAALAQQSAYGVPQTVGDKFWSPTGTFGQTIVDGKVSATDDTAIQQLLDDMVAGVTAALE